jgi:hypothetical protein
VQGREEVECNKSGLRGVVVMRRSFGVGAAGGQRIGAEEAASSLMRLSHTWPARTIAHVYAYFEFASLRIA